MNSILESIVKLIKVSAWGLAAVFILPCVFVATNLYPVWEKWIEDL
ncbi:MAG TPA: hypothetical protein VJJ28_01165 [Candidatus Paceibacterota bacterium]